MTFIDGMVARDAIDTMGNSRRLPLLEELGRQVGFSIQRELFTATEYFKTLSYRMAAKPFIIDFGMATKSSEARGSWTDLHLLQRSLIATHALEGNKSFKRVAKGYREAAGEETTRSSLAKPRKLHGEDDTSPSDKRTLWFVTQNSHKYQEARRTLDPFGIRIRKPLISEDRGSERGSW